MELYRGVQVVNVVRVLLKPGNGFGSILRAQSHNEVVVRELRRISLDRSFPNVDQPDVLVDDLDLPPSQTLEVTLNLSRLLPPHHQPRKKRWKLETSLALHHNNRRPTSGLFGQSASGNQPS